MGVLAAPLTLLGRANSGPAARWEARAAQSRQTPYREARMLSLRASILTLQHDSDRVRGLAGLDVALLVRFACHGEVPPVQQALAKIGRRVHAHAVRWRHAISRQASENEFLRRRDGSWGNQRSRVLWNFDPGHLRLRARVWPSLP